MWQPSSLSRVKAFLAILVLILLFYIYREVTRHVLLKDILGGITFGALAILVALLLFYIYREVTRDVLIIDPFTVPKHFEEAGLTSEVMANRIGDKLHQTETATQTRMKKDNLISFREEGSVPDVEIPGTKLGLKAIVDITRALFGIYPKHISGDIVLPVDAPAKVGSPPVQQQARVPVYLTQGRSRSAGVPLDVPADDLELLVQTTAEAALGQVNPYMLAGYRYRRQEYEKAIEIAERIIQDPFQDIFRKSAAFNLLGIVLDDQGKHDEAIAQYQKAIKLDPKNALAYNNWGSVLDEQKKYDEAIVQYQKAIELNPKLASAYLNWGNALSEQKKYDEAIAQYQKAVELDPKDADAYNNLGNVLMEQKRYGDAVAKFRKAIELDPTFADAYNGWGVALKAQGKYDEAEAKFQKARELSGSQ